MVNHEQRIVGCLVGGALGDAIGANFENMPPGTQFIIPDSLFVTDDTQLTLATAEAILADPTVEPEVVAQAFVRWFTARCISGIGSSTLKALSELAAGGHWALVGASGERSAGNGAAMRVAPLAFFLDPDEPTNRQKIRDICRITHRNDDAYMGALTLVYAIRDITSGRCLDWQFLESLVSKIPDCVFRDRIIEVTEIQPTIESYVRQFSATGYVVDSVPLALVAMVNGSGFMSTLEQLATVGGDTDSNASMFGQMYGAAYGIKNLPDQYLVRIDEAELIQATAKKLAKLAEELSMR